MSSVSATKAIAPVHQQSDKNTDCGGNADRLPRVVMNILVGRPSRSSGAIDRVVLHLLQSHPCRAQLRFNLRPQIARLVSRFLGGLLEQCVSFGENVGEILDQRFAAALESCSGHVHLLGETRRIRASSRERPIRRLGYYRLLGGAALAASLSLIPAV